MGWLDRLLPGRAEPEPPPGPLADLAAASVVPPEMPLDQVELLAVDLETTGLDPRKDELLSVGFVVVRAGQVHLATARHLRVRPRGQVGDSAVVHGLTDDALAGAPPVEEVLPQVLRALVASGSSETAATAPTPATTPAPEGAAAPEGSATARSGHRRVLLAHFSQVEATFLAAAARHTYGTTVGLQVVDTLEIARRLLRAQHHELPAGQVRLDACRRRHGLPRYRAHSAVVDAVACAELFLAQTAELQADRDRPLTLGDVLERGLR